MVKYENGKIYRIVCNITGLQYIGSTVSTLSHRKSQHKVLFQNWKKHNKQYSHSFKVLENNNYDIVLIENFSCKDKNELEARERYYIETLDCVNKNIPTRSKKEYKSVNKHLDKKYYEKNKDAINEYKKEWYLKNKDKILINQKERYVCECGKEIRKCGLYEHKKTKVHLDFIKNTNA